MASMETANKQLRSPAPQGGEYVTDSKPREEATTMSVVWGVRIAGEHESQTQIFTDEWSARANAASNKSWCSTVPRIIERRTVVLGPWVDATVVRIVWDEDTR